MNFFKYLNETRTGIQAWEKYFKDKEVKTIIKKTSPVYDLNMNKTEDTLESGEEITVPSSSFLEKGKIKVMYKGVPVYVTFGNIKKPTTKGGEQLSIQATKLIQTAPGKTVTVNDKTFPAKVFYKPMEITNSISNGIGLIKTIPDDLRDILLKYLSQKKFSKIDWQGYDNRLFKAEIAKYLGELLIGLCVLNNELNVITGSNPFSGVKIKEFIVPTDSSFAGVDSMFNTTKNESIPISSKSDKGAPASFHANIGPKLVEANPKSNILKYMKDVLKNHNYKNMEFLYHIGINYIMGRYLKSKIGEKIKRNPYQIYQNLSKNNITELEEYLFEVVEKHKWPVMKNQKNIISKLPNSFTYFLCQNIAEVINKDKKAIDELLQILNAKNFYQANLNKSKFLKGEIEFKLIHSGEGQLKVLQGKGSMRSVKAEQGRLSYMIT